MHIACTPSNSLSGRTEFNDGFGTHSPEVIEQLRRLRSDPSQVRQEHQRRQANLGQERRHILEEMQRIRQEQSRRQGLEPTDGNEDSIGPTDVSPETNPTDQTSHNGNEDQGAEGNIPRIDIIEDSNDSSLDLPLNDLHVSDITFLLPLLNTLNVEELEGRLDQLVSDVEDVNVRRQQAADETSQAQLQRELNALLEEVKYVNDLLSIKRNQNFDPQSPEVLASLTDQELETIHQDLAKQLESVNGALLLSQRAIEVLENSSPQKLKYVRAKLFPIEKSYGRYFPKTKGDDLKSVTLENQNGFQVQTINPISQDVLENFGQAQKVELFFDCPDEAFCQGNRFVLDGQRTYHFESSDQTSFVLSLVPLTQTSSDKVSLFENGYTRLVWGECPQNTEVRLDCRDRQYPWLYRGFFRGYFQVQFAHREKYEPEKRWAVINAVDIDEYMLSVLPAELDTVYPEASEAQLLAVKTYVISNAIYARTRSNPRAWDVLATAGSQLYRGGEAEKAENYSAIVNTRDQVLMANGQIIGAEFFASASPRTKSFYDDIEYRARNIPSSVSCPSQYKKDDGSCFYGHGRGLCQFCAEELAKNGWPRTGRPPTQGACLPEDIHQPWKSHDIICYFYNQTRVESMSEIRI